MGVPAAVLAVLEPALTMATLDLGPPGAVAADPPAGEIGDSSTVMASLVNDRCKTHLSTQLNRSQSE